MLQQAFVYQQHSAKIIGLRPFSWRNILDNIMRDKNKIDKECGKGYIGCICSVFCVWDWNYIYYKLCLILSFKSSCI